MMPLLTVLEGGINNAVIIAYTADVLRIVFLLKLIRNCVFIESYNFVAGKIYLFKSVLTAEIEIFSVCGYILRAGKSLKSHNGILTVIRIYVTDKKTVEVDLVELKRQEDIRNTNPNEADLKTWEEVVEFQKIHKYHFNWCVRYAKKHDVPIPKKYDNYRWANGLW